MNYWKVFCMEKEYPGLWQRWFKHQCVAVGWCSKWGFNLRGETEESNGGWGRTRSKLEQIQEEDWILVQLKNHRVGRVGQVVSKEVEDNEWNPLVPQTKADPDGEMGRRINVRWRLDIGPFDPEMVVKLPEGKRLSSGSARQTVAKIDRATFESVQGAMDDDINWRNLLSKFRYERSLSDYIATYPHRVEDGLQPYPSEKVREKVFPDGSRSDVLLIDRNEVPVVVECKQGTPTVENVQQLRGYMKHLRDATGKIPRGILIHGGARKLREDVRREVNQETNIEVVQYALVVGFAPCR
jgi:Endonuclease NucS